MDTPRTNTKMAAGIISKKIFFAGAQNKNLFFHKITLSLNNFNDKTAETHAGV
jgi:hypothetical protein